MCEISESEQENSFLGYAPFCLIGTLFFSSVLAIARVIKKLVKLSLLCFDALYKLTIPA